MTEYGNSLGLILHLTDIHNSSYSGMDLTGFDPDTLEEAHKKLHELKNEGHV